MQIILPCELLVLTIALFRKECTYIDRLTVSPKSFKLIEITCFLVENVNDDIAVIKDYPSVAGISLTALGFNTLL